MKRDVVVAAFKIQMVSIIDPSLLCRVNLQASSYGPSSSRLKRLSKRNGLNRNKVFRVSFPLLVSSIYGEKWFKAMKNFLGFLGKWFI